MRLRSRKLHLICLWLFIASIVPTYFWWYDSVTWLIVMSLWACISSCWSSYESACAREEIECQAKTDEPKPLTNAQVWETWCHACKKHKAAYQWRACADNAWRPVCLQCDIALNALVLEFLKDTSRTDKMVRYSSRVRAEAAARLETTDLSDGDFDSVLVGR